MRASLGVGAGAVSSKCWPARASHQALKKGLVLWLAKRPVKVGESAQVIARTLQELDR